MDKNSDISTQITVGISEFYIFSFFLQKNSKNLWTFLKICSIIDTQESAVPVKERSWRCIVMSAFVKKRGFGLYLLKK